MLNTTLPHTVFNSQYVYFSANPFGPEFTAPVNNITVAVGRDATFTCPVHHLGGYRVSVHRLEIQFLDVSLLRKYPVPCPFQKCRQPRNRLVGLVLINRLHECSTTRSTCCWTLKTSPCVHRLIYDLASTRYIETDRRQRILTRYALCRRKSDIR